MSLRFLRRFSCSWSVWKSIDQWVFTTYYITAQGILHAAAGETELALAAYQEALDIAARTGQGSSRSTSTRPRVRVSGRSAPGAAAATAGESAKASSAGAASRAPRLQRVVRDPISRSRPRALVVPDTFSAIYEYPGNLQINYSCYFGNDHYGYGEQLCGNEGTIEVMNRQDLYFTPESYRGKAPANIASRHKVSAGKPVCFMRNSASAARSSAPRSRGSFQRWSWRR